MKYSLLLLTATLALSAQAANSKPDWVDGNSAKYPREHYLLGVGQGDDRQSAEERSRGEISKIFSAQVSVNTNLTATETTIKQGASTQNDFQQSISNSVQTVSKKALEGVEIVEKWQDQATREHYALAVLDRSKALMAVNEKILEFDKQAQQWKSQLDSAGQKLARVKAALKLQAILNARQDLTAELRVLDPGGKAPSSPYDEPSVRAAAAKAISELEVVVYVR